MTSKRKYRSLFSSEILPDNAQTQAAGIQKHNFLFTRVTPLLQYISSLKGTSKKVTNDDLHGSSSQESQVGDIILLIENYINKHPDKYRDQNNFDLLSLYIHIIAKDLLIGLILSLSQSLVGCFGIFLLDLLTDCLKEIQNEENVIVSQKVSVCFLLIFMVGSFVTQNILSTQYHWLEAKWKIRTKTLLDYLVFQKQMKAQQLSSSSQSEEGEEDNDEAPPNIMNIMTIDIETQLNMFLAISEAITGVITIAVILYFIYYKIGDALFKGMFVLVGAFLLNALASQGFIIFSQKSLIWRDKRVALSQDVIAGMKSIKYLGWENIFQNKIEFLRSEEYKYATVTRIFDGLLSIFWNCSTYLLLFVLLTGFIDEGNDLRDSNVFTIIALFGSLIQPVSMLSWTFNLVMKQSVSYKRIKKYLNEKEINIKNVVNIDEEMGTPFKPKTEIAIELKDLVFQWPQRSPKETKQSKDQKLPASNDIEMELIAKNGENGSSANTEEFNLSIQNLTIKKGELAVVIGKIGSGKSALLQGILNELDILPRKNTKKPNLFEDFYDNKIIVNGNIAYVSQNHWLQNKTIRDNILFGQQFDQQWYDTVIEASDLAVDFNTFSKGDLKLIGPGGGNLSGGQRQRISISRAVYASKDIYLFDDIFSSLDKHVAEKIYQKMIVELLLGKLKRTVVLVTSHFGIFTNQEIINQIVYLEQGKIVSSQQQIKEFIQYGLTKQQQEENEKKEEEKRKLELDLIFQGQDSNQNEGSSRVDQVLQKQELEEQNKEKVTINTAGPHLSLGKDDKQQLSNQKKIDSQEESEQVEEEEREKGGINKDTLFTYFRMMGWGLLAGFVVCNFLMNASQMLVDFWLKDYVSQISEIFAYINSIYGDFGSTFFMLIALNIGLTVIRAVFYCACAIIGGKRMFNKLSNSVIHSKMKFFDKNPTGRIINRLSDDVAEVDGYVPFTCHVFMENIAFAIGYPIGIMIQFPYFIFLGILTIWLIYFVQSLFRESNRELSRLSAINSGKVLSVVGDISDGSVEIRVFQKQTILLKEFLFTLDQSMRSFLISEAVNVWMTLRLLFISDIMFSCVAVVCALTVLLDWDFHYQSLALSLTYSILLSERFTEVMSFYCQIEGSMISVERIKQYFNNDQEQLDQQINRPNKSDESNKFKTQIGFRDNLEENALINYDNKARSDISIEFSNVYITYDALDDPTKLTKDSTEVQYALKNVSFQIKKGEKIAFCGRTGSGKTSILNVLFGMYPIQFGNIFVHGKNITYYTLRQLREQMSIIPQFGFLYNETLLKNLDPLGAIPKDIVASKVRGTGLRIREKGDDEKEEQDNISRSRKSSGLSKKSEKEKNQKDIASINHVNNSEKRLSIRKESVSSLKSEEKEDHSRQINQQNNNNNSSLFPQIQDDLDFKIEDGGSNLSNGEKQIVNFLRVILRDTEIVCLDEVSSNMDPKTDALLHEQIFKFAQNKTLIVITHRLESIALFDRVVVMDNGGISECGHVEELKQQKGGFFNRLFSKDN